MQNSELRQGIRTKTRDETVAKNTNKGSFIAQLVGMNYDIFSLV